MVVNNIIYRIPAVRSREQYALDLCEKLNEPASSIFWDEERKGSVWNKFRIWELYKQFPEASHICMLDDDADVVHDFKDFVDIMTDFFPDAIMTFCHCNANPVRFKEKGLRTPYMLLKNFDFRGISVCLPVKYIPEYLDWHRAELSWYKRDDTSLKMFAVLKHIPCMLTIPNLVRPREIPSAIHPWCQVRPSDLWKGYDIDKAQFKTSEYVVRQNERMFDLHTSKQYPILDKVRQEYARTLMMWR